MVLQFLICISVYDAMRNIIISCLFAVLLFVVFLARVAFSLSTKQELNIWVYEKCLMMINQKGKVETSSAKRQIRLEICLWQRWVKISFCNFLVSHNLKHFNKNSFSLSILYVSSLQNVSHSCFDEARSRVGIS